MQNLSTVPHFFYEFFILLQLYQPSCRISNDIHIIVNPQHCEDISKRIRIKLWGGGKTVLRSMLL
jgi:hypothetical protein